MAVAEELAFEMTEIRTPLVRGVSPYSVALAGDIRGASRSGLHALLSVALALSMCASAASCGDDDATIAARDDAMPDARLDRDVGSGADLGSSTPTDGGIPDVDAGGDPLIDAGGDPPIDAGGDPPVDAGEDPPADAGSDAAADDAGPPPPPPCPHAGALEASTVAELARQGISGVALGIDMPGCLWMGAAGLADRAAGRAVVPGDRFPIASITKTFTAAVILQLVDEGRLDLGDTIDAFVAFPSGDRITIRHLLAHTSGIADYFNRPDVLARAAEPWTRDEVLDVARAVPLAFAPGSAAEYSNTNYFVLGVVIEAVTGNPYHEEVRRRLLEPHGLDDTYLAGPESLPGAVVRGYARVGGDFVDVTDDVHPSLTWAAGGLVSTVDDLDRWARALFAGTVLSPAMRTAMLTPERLPTGAVLNVGLGVSIEDLPRGLGRYYGHLGRIQGYYLQLGYLPDHDAVMVQLTNDQDGAPNTFMTEMWMVVGLI